MDIEQAVAILSRWADAERKYVSASYGQRYQSIDSVLAELSRLRAENGKLAKERGGLKTAVMEFKSSWLRKCSNCEGVGCGLCAGEGWVCRECGEPEGDCECGDAEEAEGGDGGS